MSKKIEQLWTEKKDAEWKRKPVISKLTAEHK